MQKVGVPIATQNASVPCKNAAVHVTKASGGEGAFREAVEWILAKQGRLVALVSQVSILQLLEMRLPHLRLL